MTKYERMAPNERTRARLLRAYRRRIALIILLAKLAPNGAGYACDECGVVHHESMLTIDHVDKITWDPRKLSPQMRVARYWREHNAGVRLRVVCGSCNSSDGARRRYRRYA